MKLIESPINKNVNLETSFPNVSKFLFENTAIKYYKIYTLDLIKVLYLDVYNKIRVVLVSTEKKVRPEEIDFVINQLLNENRDQVQIEHAILERMEEAGYQLQKPVKDIVVLTVDTSKD